MKKVKPDARRKSVHVISLYCVVSVVAATLTKLMLLLLLLLLQCHAHYSPSPGNAARRMSSTGATYIIVFCTLAEPAAPALHCSATPSGNIAACNLVPSAVLAVFLAAVAERLEALVTTTAAELVVVILQLGLTAGGRASEHLALDHTARCHARR